MTEEEKKLTVKLVRRKDQLLGHCFLVMFALLPTIMGPAFIFSGGDNSIKWMGLAIFGISLPLWGLWIFVFRLRYNAVKKIENQLKELEKREKSK